MSKVIYISNYYELQLLLNNLFFFLQYLAQNLLLLGTQYTLFKEEDKNQFEL